MNDRMKIAKAARYLDLGANGVTYYVRWNGTLYSADDPGELVDKVLESTPTHTNPHQPVTGENNE